ncbi:MAG: hypothetical protein R3C97_04260 [Geminicoccaceae bacterium]
MSAHRLSIHILLAAALLLPATAFADRIDGNWCASDGRLFSIDGSAIITPRGASLTGQYGRHTFAYTIPGGEPGEGGEAQMRQLNDETVHVLWPEAVEVEVWNRCDVTS